VKAKVLSQQSAGNQQSTLLSTVEDEMGVVFARSNESGLLMIPLTWNDFVCVKTKKKEKRKVAKP
jgi:exosome complex component CSL4